MNVLNSIKMSRLYAERYKILIFNEHKKNNGKLKNNVILYLRYTTYIYYIVLQFTVFNLNDCSI